MIMFRSLSSGIAGWIFHLLRRERAADILDRFIRLYIRRMSPSETLRFLFDLDARLYSLQGQMSVAYGRGIHTKHHHINYHQFFVKRLKPGERVIDIGSGNGFLAYDMANQVKGVQVVGIELRKSNVKHAREKYRHPNLHFIHGDALKDLPNETFDVVTLSNVLEHIEHRIAFLRKVLSQIHPKRLIIRVPMFERDWRVPLKKELGMEWRLDKTHETEYTVEQFEREMEEAGLHICHKEIRWGEIWAEAVTDGA